MTTEINRLEKEAMSQKRSGSSLITLHSGYLGNLLRSTCTTCIGGCDTALLYAMLYTSCTHTIRYVAQLWIY